MHRYRLLICCNRMCDYEKHHKLKILLFLLLYLLIDEVLSLSVPDEQAMSDNVTIMSKNFILFSI